MKIKSILASIAVFGLLAAPTAVDAANTATAPKMVTVSLTPLTKYEIRTTVTLDAPALVTVTSEAYRHPLEVEFSAVLPAGSTAVAIPCKSTVLPHSWKVRVGNVLVASASLKCE